MSRHWIHQIQSILGVNDKPIMLVGTHADELIRRKEDPYAKMREVVYLLNLKIKEIHGCFPVSLKSGFGVEDFKCGLVSLALTHPQIGILRAKVPITVLLIQKRIQSTLEQNKRCKYNEGMNDKQI